MDINQSYSNYYRKKDARHLYPTEFVVRAFLGSYPHLSLNKDAFQGASILDLGFGDGRNLGFLADQGFGVHGLEITAEIVAGAKARLAAMGYQLDLRVGRNNAIPFESDRFDYLLACHSCYYLDEGDDLDDNFREIARVLKPGGCFVGSIPGTASHLLHGAEELGRGIMRVRRDQYGIRNGSLVASVSSCDELKARLSPFFEDFHLGFCDNDFWGTREHVYTFVVKNRSLSPK